MTPEQTSKPLANFFIHSDAAKLVGLAAGFVGFFAVIVTLYQIQVDLRDRNDERVARTEERIARATEQVMARASGNTGKGRSLSILIRAGGILDYADLSCRTLGNFDVTNNVCIDPPQFTNFDLLSDDVTPQPEYDMRGINFSATIIASSVIEDTDITQGNFENTVFDTNRIEGSYFYGRFAGSTFRDSEIVNTFILPTTVEEWPTLENVNVSGTTIPWIESLSDEELSQLYFWADMPPLRAPYVVSGVIEGVGKEMTPEDDRQRFHEIIVRPGNGDDTRRKVSLMEDYTVAKDDILSKMNICLPPTIVSGDGIVVAPSRIRTMFDRNNDLHCEQTTLAEAKSNYPKSYQPLQAHITDRRQPSAFTGLIDEE